MITVHTIVGNEERFVKAALQSVLSSADVTRVLAWDTGSIDHTQEQILSLSDPRVEFQQKGKTDREGIVRLRQRQLSATKTPWFLLVDGDEIWPEKNLRKLIEAMSCGARYRTVLGKAGQCSNPPATHARRAGGRGETIALVNRTRNVVGDLYHYLPESAGHYRIGPWKGHLNIRAMRNIQSLTVNGQYPNEWYELNGKKIQDQPQRLQFVDTWYLHTTHLRRSSSWLAELTTIDRPTKYKWFYRLREVQLIEMSSLELPESLRTK